MFIKGGELRSLEYQTSEVHVILIVIFMTEVYKDIY